MRKPADKGIEQSVTPLQNVQVHTGVHEHMHLLARAKGKITCEIVEAFQITKEADACISSPSFLLTKGIQLHPKRAVIMR